MSLSFICLKYVNQHNRIRCGLWNLAFFICSLGSVLLHLLILELLPLGRVAALAVGVAGVLEELVPGLVEGPPQVLPEVLGLGFMEPDGSSGSFGELLVLRVLLEDSLEVGALWAPDIVVFIAWLDLGDRLLILTGKGL